MTRETAMGYLPNETYGFREPPFRMTPDARMFFPSSVHTRAHAHLLFGIAQNEGFVVVTGEVGAGKTTLIEHLCAELDPASFHVARIMTTQVSGDDLLRLVAGALDAETDGAKSAVLQSVAATLGRATRRHLLIVDEAQGLSFQALEELRMLSNLSEGGRSLLQTILLGQPELRRMLARPELDQLRQRVLASFHLGSLSRGETRDYVQHRMRAVGWQGFPAWEDDALDLVHRHSGGIPRRINRLCGRILLEGELERAPRLTGAMVEAVAMELEDDLSAGAPARLPPAASSQAAPDLADLARRIAALERVVARRERVFERFRDLFSDGRGGR